MVDKLSEFLLDTKVTRGKFIAGGLAAFLLSCKSQGLPELTPVLNSPSPTLIPTPTLKDVLTNQAPEEETAKALSTRFITDANNLLDQYAQPLLWTPERFGRERETITKQAEREISGKLKDDYWKKYGGGFSPWFSLGRNDNDADLEFSILLVYVGRQDLNIQTNIWEVRNVLY